jgi:hypothetical protein
MMKKSETKMIFLTDSKKFTKLIYFLQTPNYIKVYIFILNYFIFLKEQNFPNDNAYRMEKLYKSEQENKNNIEIFLINNINANNLLEKNKKNNLNYNPLVDKTTVEVAKKLSNILNKKQFLVNLLNEPIPINNRGDAFFSEDNEHITVSFKKKKNNKNKINSLNLPLKNFILEGLKNNIIEEIKNNITKIIKDIYPIVNHLINEINIEQVINNNFNSSNNEIIYNKIKSFNNYNITNNINNSIHKSGSTKANTINDKLIGKFLTENNNNNNNIDYDKYLLINKKRQRNQKVNTACIHKDKKHYAKVNFIYYLNNIEYVL